MPERTEHLLPSSAPHRLFQTDAPARPANRREGGREWTASMFILPGMGFHKWARDGSPRKCKARVPQPSIYECVPKDVAPQLQAVIVWEPAKTRKKETSK